MSEEVWKIRQKSTGLFASGGGVDAWNHHLFWKDKGKKWNARHHLVSHMRNNLKFYMSCKDDIEIVKMEVVESEVSDGVGFVMGLYDDAATKKKRREAERAVQRLEYLKKEQNRIEQELKKYGKNV